MPRERERERSRERERERERLTERKWEILTYREDKRVKYFPFLKLED